MKSFILFAVCCMLALSISAQENFMHIINYDDIPGPDNYIDLNYYTSDLNPFSTKIKTARIAEISVNNQHWLYDENGLLIRAEYRNVTEHDTIFEVREYAYYNRYKLYSERYFSTSTLTGEKKTDRSSARWFYSQDGLVDSVLFEFYNSDNWMSFCNSEIGNEITVSFFYDDDENIVRQIVSSFDKSLNDTIHSFVSVDEDAQTFQLTRKLYEDYDYFFRTSKIKYDGLWTFLSYGMSRPSIQVFDEGFKDYIYLENDLLSSIVLYQKKEMTDTLTNREIWHCNFNWMGLPETIFLPGDTLNFKYRFYENSEPVVFGFNSSMCDYSSVVQRMKTCTTTNDAGKKFSGLSSQPDVRKNLTFIIHKRDSFIFINEYLLLAVHKNQRYYYALDSLVAFQQVKGKSKMDSAEIRQTARNLLSKAVNKCREVDLAFGIHVSLDGFEPAGTMMYFPRSLVKDLSRIQISDGKYKVLSYVFTPRTADNDHFDMVVQSDEIPDKIKEILSQNVTGSYFFSNIKVQSLETSEVFVIPGFKFSIDKNK